VGCINSMAPKRWLPVFILLLLLLLQACSTVLHGNSLPVVHTVRTVNAGSVPLKSVVIEYTNHGHNRARSVIKYITPHAPGSRRATGGERAVPAEMLVKWVTEAGAAHEAAVAMPWYGPQSGLREIQLEFKESLLKVFEITGDPDDPYSEKNKKQIFPRN
jgi:hypothetical protein